jgi:hypothetical protein
MLLQWVKYQRDRQFILSNMTNAVSKLEEEIASTKSKYYEDREQLIKEDASEASLQGRKARFDTTVYRLDINLQKEKTRLQELETAYLVGKARELNHDVPNKSDTEAWMDVPAMSSEVFENKKILTVYGITKLRSALRKEQKERFDVIQSRIALALGLIGSITGIISLIISLSRGH